MNKDRIWITGASRGIGFETALLLAEQGMTLFLSARNNSTELQENILNKYDAEFIKCDVSDSSQVRSAYDRIRSKAGGLDILINNAGIVIYNDLVDSSEEEFDNLMNINFKGPYLTIKAALPDMLKQSKGLIMNVSSVAALRYFRSSALYSASKAALLALSRTLRDEVRTMGVKVVDILPGATNTDMWDPASRDKFGDKMMQSSDVANAIQKLIELNRENRILAEELIIRPIGGDL